METPTVPPLNLPPVRPSRPGDLVLGLEDLLDHERRLLELERRLALVEQDVAEIHRRLDAIEAALRKGEA